MPDKTRAQQQSVGQKPSVQAADLAQTSPFATICSTLEQSFEIADLSSKPVVTTGFTTVIFRADHVLPIMPQMSWGAIGWMWDVGVP